VRRLGLGGSRRGSRVCRGSHGHRAGGRPVPFPAYPVSLAGVRRGQTPGTLTVFTVQAGGYPLGISRREKD
jgi:hypothetical protein